MDTLGSKTSQQTDTDTGYGGSAKYNDENKGSDPDIQLWDTFKCTPIQRKTGSMVQKRFYAGTLIFLKLIVYGILFTLNILGSFVSKSTELYAVGLISGRRLPFDDGSTFNLPLKARATWMWCIILCFAIPELIAFVWSPWLYLCIGCKLPKLHFFGVVGVAEILHCLGLALLFFVGLPDLDVIQAATAFSCVCLVPGLLGVFSGIEEQSSNKNDKFALYETIGDITALLLQIFGLVTFTYLGYQNEDAFAPWILPIALALCSVRWWGNYASPDSKIGFVQLIARYSRELHLNNQKFEGILKGFRAVVRLVTFLLGAFLIALWKGMDSKDFVDGILMKDYNISVYGESGCQLLQKDRWLPIYIFLIHAVSSLCVYSCALFACKTRMQNFGFALAMNLSVPVTFLGFLLLPSSISLDFPFILSSSRSLDWYDWLWVAWLISLLWITRHVWSASCERLATPDRIFAVPMYDSLLVDQSLALARWREEPEEYDYANEQSEFIKEYIPNNEMSSTIRKEDTTTRIYACATMWHETPEEMTDFLNSILRLDSDQGCMRMIRKKLDYHRDYYELEVHIFFDDAFRCVKCHASSCVHQENTNNPATRVNDYVLDFVNTVEKCIKARDFKPSPPEKFPAVYGGRLLFTLPQETKMYVHLKDKNKIRAKKRWSQVMYMYYLLGYRLMQSDKDVMRKEVISRNTYILTLDGDIDFRPSAVKVLVDRMKINPDLGSVCGRIHPLGDGPLVWYQKFEYAVGHWLQKATEHVIGSVLCSPGCFALFRASALMGNNVMKKYSTVPQQAQEFIQYDQGEDRWLCTLLLQNSQKIEYSAASDAYTHAPESFNDFYIQRRRWIPSTVANIFDLLETADVTKKKNKNISGFYIGYQKLLMISTILGPGTIFLMLVGSFVAVFPIGMWTSFIYNFIPVLGFCLVCYFFEEKTQLLFAGVLSAIYGLVMVVVLVGAMIQVSQDGWLAPTSLLFIIFVGEYIATGLLHPLEWGCLLCGIIYYVTVPSMYMILIIFSLFNMNNISWGTREAPKAIVVTEGEQGDAEIDPNGGVKTTVPAAKTEANKRSTVWGFFQSLFGNKQSAFDGGQFIDLKLGLTRIETKLDNLKSSLENQPAPSVYPKPTSPPPRNDNNSEISSTTGLEMSDEEDWTSSDTDSESDDDVYKGPSNDQQSGDFLTNPNWIFDKQLGRGAPDFLKPAEEDFWKRFIAKYLLPIDKDVKKEKENAQKILELRNQYIFKFFMINALFVLVIFLMQSNKDILHFNWPLGSKTNITYVDEGREVRVTREQLRLEPIGCLFIVGFIGILFIQFVAMLFHRFETFSHIISKISLDIDCCSGKDLSEEAKLERHVNRLLEENQRQFDHEPKPDPAENVPPSKRLTVCRNVASDKRKTLQSQNSFILDGSNDRTARNLPRSTVQALNRRRTIVVDAERLDRNHDYATVEDIRPRQRGTEPQTAYDNHAFSSDNPQPSSV